MINPKKILIVLCAIVVTGGATIAHAQTGSAIDTSGLSGSPSGAGASGSVVAASTDGAVNPVPGEPGRVVSIPEPGTALLALGGISLLGLAIIRRRK